MHVLPLPFGLALVLLPRTAAPLIRLDPRPIRVTCAPGHREAILRDPAAAMYRRPIG